MARPRIDCACQRLQSTEDAVGDEDRGLVIPCANDCPARLLKAAVGVAIAAAVGLDLGAPPLGVCFWPRTVLGTAVPETPVDVHSDAAPREDDIGPSTHRWQRRSVHEETKAASMQFRAHSELGHRVALARRAHTPERGR